jgi:hypothetical protein
MPNVECYTSVTPFATAIHLKVFELVGTNPTLRHLVSVAGTRIFLTVPRLALATTVVPTCSRATELRRSFSSDAGSSISQPNIEMLILHVSAMLLVPAPLSVNFVGCSTCRMQGLISVGSTAPPALAKQPSHLETVSPRWGPSLVRNCSVFCRWRTFPVVSMCHAPTHLEQAIVLPAFVNVLTPLEFAGPCVDVAENHADAGMAVAARIMSAAVNMARSFARCICASPWFLWVLAVRCRSD